MRIRFLLVALMVGCTLLALNGCGFRLRGSAGVSVPLPVTYVQGANASGVLLSELRRALNGAGVKVTEDREQAQAILTVFNEDKSRRVLSVGVAGAASEFELHYAVTFDVNDQAGKPLQAAQTVGLERAVSFSQADVLAKGAEEDLLYRDMRRDVIQGILRRLSAIGKAAEK